MLKDQTGIEWLGLGQLEMMGNVAKQEGQPWLKLFKNYCADSGETCTQSIMQQFALCPLV
jgi:hypothetical protein